MGDGVLAYFGWPRAHEDDAERAVRAGLAIAAAVPGIATPAGEPLAARVGIATGLVVVGDLSARARPARRRWSARPRTWRRGCRRRRRPGPWWSPRARGGCWATCSSCASSARSGSRASSSPVRAIEVAGERRAGSRFEARGRAGRRPWSGAKQELACVLERWRAGLGRGGPGGAAGRRGRHRQVAAGAGRAGAVEAEEHSGAPLPVLAVPHRHTPLWPVSGSSASRPGSKPATTTRTQLGKLEALLRQGREPERGSAGAVGRRPARDRPAIATRRRTSARGSGAPDLGGAGRAGPGLARRGPVLVVLEDAHWADPTTLELVGLALDRIAGARVLLLVTSRPDGQPALGGHPRMTRLSLNRLGRGPSEAIVARLTGGGPAPGGAGRDRGPDRRRAAVRRGADQGGARGRVLGGDRERAAVPRLAARLAHGPARPRARGQGGGAGRGLHRARVRLPAARGGLAVAGTGAAGRPWSGWPRRSWSSRAASRPRRPTAFKHALVRDAAHESLLRAERQRAARPDRPGAGGALPETAEAEPELLARHCAEAGLADRRSTTGSAPAAGARALRDGRGGGPADQGVGGAGGLPDDLSVNGGAGLQLALGQASIAARGFAAPETGRAYTRARDLCWKIGEAPQLFPAMVGQWSFHFNRGEIDRSVTVGEDLLQLAQQRQDLAARVMAHRTLGCALLCLGKLDPARGHLEQNSGPVRPRPPRLTRLPLHLSRPLGDWFELALVGLVHAGLSGAGPFG